MAGTIVGGRIERIKNEAIFEGSFPLVQEPELKNHTDCPLSLPGGNMGSFLRDSNFLPETIRNYKQILWRKQPYEEQNAF